MAEAIALLANNRAQVLHLGHERLFPHLMVFFTYGGGHDLFLYPYDQWPG